MWVLGTLGSSASAVHTLYCHLKFEVYTIYYMNKSGVPGGELKEELLNLLKKSALCPWLCFSFQQHSSGHRAGVAVQLPRPRSCVGPSYGPVLLSLFLCVFHCRGKRMSFL